MKIENCYCKRRDRAGGNNAMGEEGRERERIAFGTLGSVDAAGGLRGGKEDAEDGQYGLVITANSLQFNFRMQALDGNLPGVKKASW